MSQFYKSVVTGVLVKNSLNQFLFVKKTPGKGPYEGMFLPPGGMVDDGERIDEAAKREVYEETGVHISNLKRVYFNDDLTKDWAGNVKHFIGLLYTAEYESGELSQTAGNDDTFEEVGWFSLEELASMPLSPPVKDLLRISGYSI